MSYTNDDMGNAERLRDEIKGKLIYSPKSGQWFSWNGNRWVGADRSILMETAKKAINKMQKAAVLDSSKEAMAWAEKSRAYNQIISMIRLVEQDPEVTVHVSDFDANGMQLNCLNGIIDLASGELLPHNQNFYCTKLAPANYNIRNSKGIWEKFVLDIMGGNQTLVEFLQRALGYSLTTSLKEQCMFILYGSGANGKSKFIEAVRSTLGSYCKATAPATLTTRRSGEIRNDIARLAGARFVSAVEMNPKYGSKIDGAMVKQMTGDDTIEARFLYHESFEFVPTWKVWLATNHLPEVPSSDTGMWRRVQVVPFLVSFLGQADDKDISQKLFECKDDILTWMVQGCLKWQEEGLGKSPAVELAINEYREEQDPVHEFIHQCCYLHPDAQTEVSRLYECYLEYCKVAHEKCLGKKEFGNEIKKNIIIRQGRTDTTRYWLGIAIKRSINLLSLTDEEE